MTANQVILTTEDDLLAGLQGIDPNTVEPGGESYPFAQWVNGQSTQKRAGGVAYTGGWFINGEAIDGELPGWTKDVLIHRDNTETEGWFSRDVQIAMLHLRRGWQVQINGRAQMFPWNQYDAAIALGKANGKCQVMGVIRGLEDVGPVFLTMKGSTSRAFAGRGGILEQFNRKIIVPANGLAAKKGLKARWPYRAFWLTVGPKRTDKGEPVFEAVGQGDASTQVTLPVALGLLDKPTDADVRKLYVGGTLLAQLNDLYTETDAWAHAWDQVQAEAAKEAPPEGYEAAEEPSEEIPF